MRRLVIALAASALLVTACSSSGSTEEAAADGVVETAAASAEETAAAGAATKESFCAGVEALMGDTDLPDPGPDLSQAQIDEVVTKIDSALAAVKGGVELGAITSEELDFVNGLGAVIKATYLNPGLTEGSAIPTPEDLGLTPEQYELMLSAEGSEKIDAIGSSMQDYCKAE